MSARPRPDARPMKALLLAGPTASGKSALALRLAEASGAVIVNSDAMQVYRELRVLTARPSEAEEARVPHHLFGFVPASERFSAGRYAAAMRPLLERLATSGQPAIIVGGTGLYFEALTRGLSPLPPVPAATRAAAAALLGAIGPEALHRRLAGRDPLSAAALAPSDGQRVLRAWEVLEATGTPLRVWQGQAGAPLVPPDVPRALLRPERGWLDGRIAARVEAMLDGGARAEAAALLSAGLDPALPAMKAIGVREVGAWLAGAATRAGTAAALVTLTRQYAKRQMTWARGRMADWTAFDPSDPETAARLMALAERKEL